MEGMGAQGGELIQVLIMAKYYQNKKPSKTCMNCMNRSSFDKCDLIPGLIKLNETCNAFNGGK
jgi:hypothetical protein